MSDAKQKVSVWVEKDHLSRAKDVGYTSPTTAINKGLELLMESIVEDEQRTNSGRTEDNVGRVEDGTADNGGRWVDDTENAVLRARLDELENHNDTLKIHNETLKAELEKAAQREASDKRTHDNYMAQMQTLIQQKAIEAPGAKKPWWRLW